MQHRYKKNVAIKTGFYHRLEWPDPGGVGEQDNLTVEIFKVIKDEEAKKFSLKVK